jgi:arylsulfatase A-like enzyme
MCNNFWLNFILISCITLFIGCQNHTEPDNPPNIIFIFADDHASHAVSAYGSEIIETPNIDRLAEEGIRFDKAFVTNSICAPSRAVLLTGMHSHINGQLTNAQVFDGSQQTYPQLMQRAGYQTAMIGKWHLRSDPTGYDHWDILPGQGDYYNPDFITPDGETHIEGYVTDIITDKVITWLKESRSPDQPFMINYHHKAPHRNWKPSPEHLSLFDDVTIPEPSTLFANWSDELTEYESDTWPEGEDVSRTSAVQTQEMTLMEHFSPAWDLKFPPDQVEGEWLHEIWVNKYNRFTDEQKEAWDAVYGEYYREFIELDLDDKELLSWIYQRYIKDYLSTIISIDDNLGRLLNYLEDAGLAENTVVIYTSDQGFFLGDHGWYDKRWMYEQSLHIPLVIRWPDAIRAGKVNDDLVQNLDFAPTLLDLAGIDVPDEFQGRSLLPLLQGQAPGDWRESIYYHYYEYPGPHAVQKHYGIRTDRYKLIHYYEIDEWEMFDLNEDPDELQNRYDDPAYEELLDELKKELQRLRKKYQVPENEPI